jgi:hypothetical protein
MGLWTMLILLELQFILTVKVDATISIDINLFDHIFNWGQ